MSEFDKVHFICPVCKGTKKHICICAMEDPSVCKKCGGRGMIENLAYEICPSCVGGKDLNVCGTCAGLGKFNIYESRLCDSCNGKGLSNCKICNGTGVCPCFHCHGTGKIC